MWNWYVNKNLKYLYTKPYFMNSGNILKEKNAGIFVNVKIAESKRSYIIWFMVVKNCTRKDYNASYKPSQVSRAPLQHRDLT